MRQGPVAITTSSSKCCAGDAFYANKSWPKPMTSYFAEIVNFVGAHPHYALTAVFLLALSKAIPVIGTVVPGSTLLVGISALATGADVNPWFLLVAATGGAIAGDGVSFWLGQRYHQEFLLGWPLNRYPQFIGRKHLQLTLLIIAALIAVSAAAWAIRFYLSRHPLPVRLPDIAA